MTGGRRPPGRGSPARPAPIVLYEDERIVAVDKPAGLPTIAPDGGRGRSLHGFVTEHLRRKNPKARAAVVHRIDRDTSGVVVFAKDARTKRELMSTWGERVVSRRYLALAEGRMEAESGFLDSWLRENRGGTVYETAPEAPGALRAVTRWRVLKEGGGYTLLELELETGRKHQIRAQLAAAGHPVAGDGRYGARTDPAGRLALHAAAIELARPSDGKTVKIESPAPEIILRPLRVREKGLYCGTDKAGGRRSSPRGAEPEGMPPSGRPPVGGGYMKEKSKQAKEPKKKAQKTLKEKRKEKKEKAAHKAEE